MMILRGKAFHNPDGSTDDWHEQKTHYGIAFAAVIMNWHEYILEMLE